VNPDLPAHNFRVVFRREKYFLGRDTTLGSSPRVGGDAGITYLLPSVTILEKEE